MSKIDRRSFGRVLTGAGLAGIGAGLIPNVATGNAKTDSETKPDLKKNLPLDYRYKQAMFEYYLKEVEAYCNHRIGRYSVGGIEPDEWFMREVELLVGDGISEVDCDDYRRSLLCYFFNRERTWDSNSALAIAFTRMMEDWWDTPLLPDIES